MSSKIPDPAYAVGYNTQTFNPNILLGQNWIKDTQNGTTANATTNADGSVTVAGGGDTWNGQLETYLNGQGEAFGGGFYLQVTMTVPGAVSGLSPWTGGNSNEWPSIWANSVNGSVETDFVEMMGPTPGEYGATLHNWTTGSSQGVGQDIYAPNGNTLHGANTYGMLWIPATATSNGSITFYLNGLPVGTPTTWTQANPGLFGIIDGQQMVLRLGAGANSPATFSNVQVWQASTAGNSIKGQPAPYISPTSSTPPVSALPSPDNTVVGASSVGSITDSHDNVWTITASGQVAVNGVADTTTSRVTKLAYEGGKIWQENADNFWWDKTLASDVWGPNGGTATSPIPAPTKPTITYTNEANTSFVKVLDASVPHTYTGYGATFSMTAPGVATVTLTGWAHEAMQFVHMNSVNLTAGWTATTVKDDGGTNTFTAGKGVMDVTGGVGADAYIYHANNATLTIEDFSATKGDTLTVDSMLKSSVFVGADGHGGTLVTFGSANHSVDLNGLPSITTAGIHWV